MRVTKIVIGLLTIAAGAGVLIASCQRSDPKGDVGRGKTNTEAVEVLALDNSFTPSTIEARAGDEITVEIENIGDSAHEFKIEDLDLNTGTIGAGEIAHATLIVPRGTTEFVCSYHGGMTGEIVGV